MSRCHLESPLLLRAFLQVISLSVTGGCSPGSVLLPALARSCLLLLAGKRCPHLFPLESRQLLLFLALFHRSRMLKSCSCSISSN